MYPTETLIPVSFFFYTKKKRIIIITLASSKINCIFYDWIRKLFLTVFVFTQTYHLNCVGFKTLQEVILVLNMVLSDSERREECNRFTTMFIFFICRNFFYQKSAPIHYLHTHYLFAYVVRMVLYFTFTNIR